MLDTFFETQHINSSKEFLKPLEPLTHSSQPYVCYFIHKKLEKKYFVTSTVQEKSLFLEQFHPQDGGNKPF
jgi:hypothetical protein